MSEGLKKAEDKLNMIGIVAVGVCGAVFVFVSMVLLQAFYLNETAPVETAASYGGQDAPVQSLGARQIGNLQKYTADATKRKVTLPIERAMELVARDAAVDPSKLVPAVGPSTTKTIQAVFGRPIPLAPPAPAPGATPATPTAPTLGGSPTIPNGAAPATPTAPTLGGSPTGPSGAAPPTAPPATPAPAADQRPAAPRRPAPRRPADAQPRPAQGGNAP